MKTHSKTIANKRVLHLRGRPSILETDLELKEFIEQNILQMTLLDLTNAINDKFGPERTTSKSSVDRYWQRHKERIYKENGITFTDKGSR